MKSILTNLFAILFMLSAFGQQKQEILKYIERYKQVAIDEMVRSKVPASITLAQGILETSAGASPLSRKANNHFGIKCKEEWTGDKYYHDDDHPQECFRVYEHAEASYADHSDFLLTRPRYAPLFQLPITSYKYWAYGLKEAGYATNPKYAPILISYIEDYKLYEYDKTGVAQMEEKEKIMKQPETVEPMTAQAQSRIVVTEVKNKEPHHKQIVTEPKNTETGRQEFVVNGMRAVKAQGNEDPFKIAFEYNIDFSFVMLFNDLNTGDRFKDGEYIFLQGKRNRGEEETYVVLAGESMHDISQKTGVKLKELYLKNMLKMNEQVFAGESINLQDKRKEPPRVMSYADYLKAESRTAAQSQNKSPVYASATVRNDVPDLPAENRIKNESEYHVQQSDTLYSIAKKFNTSVEQLRAINNLATTDVKAGQTLVVSK